MNGPFKLENAVESETHSIHSPNNENRQKSFFRDRHKSKMRVSLENQRGANDKIIQLSAELEERTNEIRALRKKHTSTLSRLAEREAQLAVKEEELKRKKEEFYSVEKQLLDSQVQRDAFKKQTESMSVSTAELQRKIESLKTQMKEQERAQKDQKTMLLNQLNQQQRDFQNQVQRFEKELREKSLRTEKTHASGYSIALPGVDDRHQAALGWFAELSNPNNLTFGPEVQTSESFLMQREETRKAFEEEGVLVEDKGDLVGKGHVVEEFIDRLCKAYSAVRDKLSESQRSEAKGRNAVHKLTEANTSLKALVQKMFDGLKESEKRQDALKDELSGLQKTLQNAIMDKDLEQKGDATIQSNDLGSFCQREESPKLKLLKNKTELFLKDAIALKMENRFDGRSVNKEHENPNNKTFNMDLQNACFENPCFQRLSDNNRWNTKNNSQRDNRCRKASLTEDNFDEEFNKRRADLNDHLLSPRMKEAVAPFQNLAVQGRSFCLHTDCQVLDSKIRDFTERCKRRLNKKTEVINQLIDSVERLAAAMDSSLQAVLNSTEDSLFDPDGLNSSDMFSKMTGAKHKRLRQSVASILSSLEHLPEAVKKSNARFWFQKLKELLTEPLRKGVFVDKIKTDLLDSFNRFDSCFATEPADLLLSKLDVLKRRVENLMKDDGSKDTLSVNQWRSKESIEQVKWRYDQDQTMKQKLADMIKRFMNQVISEEGGGEDEFNSDTLAAEVKEVMQTVQCNRDKVANNLGLILHKAKSSKEGDQKEIVDLQLEQLEDRDRVVTRLWQLFVGSFRSVSVNGKGLFEESTKRKVDIISRNLDRVLKELSKDSPVRLTEVVPKVLKGMHVGADTEEVIREALTPRGSLLGSAVHRSTSPFASIYATFVFPMTFLLEFLHLLRQSK